MKKTCEICFDSFDGRANQKYCPECGKNPDRARKRYAKAERISNNNAGVKDTPVIKTCEQCGNEFATLFDAKFCSNECKKTYIKETATCLNCKCKLIEKGVIIDGPCTAKRFCSDECKAAYYAKRKEEREKRKREQKHFCPVCKKYFTNSEHKFYCSDECVRKAQAERQPVRRCRRCKTTFNLINEHQYYCDNCSNIMFQNEKAAKEKKIREQGILKNGLCFYCQTTYFNCEKMKSNFVYYPKGAVVKNNKVLSCPDFTDTKQKKK